MSIRCRDQHKAVIIEALRRARYKFPGRQKIIVSKKWGFTPLDRADYEELKANKQVINDGAYVQVCCDFIFDLWSCMAWAMSHGREQRGDAEWRRTQECPGEMALVTRTRRARLRQSAHNDRGWIFASGFDNGMGARLWMPHNGERKKRPSGVSTHRTSGE